MTIKHVNSNASIEELLEIIDQDAGVIIDNVLSQSQLDKITEELNPFLQTPKKVKMILPALIQEELEL